MRSGPQVPAPTLGTCSLRPIWARTWSRAQGESHGFKCPHLIPYSWELPTGLNCPGSVQGSSLSRMSGILPQDPKHMDSQRSKAMLPKLNLFNIPI